MGALGVQYQFYNSAIFLTGEGGGAEVPPPSLHYRQLEQGIRAAHSGLGSGMGSCVSREYPGKSRLNLMAAGDLRPDSVGVNPRGSGHKLEVTKPLSPFQTERAFLGNGLVVWGNPGVIAQRGGIFRPVLADNLIQQWGIRPSPYSRHIFGCGVESKARELRARVRVIKSPPQIAKLVAAAPVEITSTDALVRRRRRLDLT